MANQPHRFDLQPRQRRQQKRTRTANRASTWGNGLVSGALAFLTVAALTVAAGLIGYVTIVSASDFPKPGDLQTEISAFQSTRIFDRQGNLLSETLDPDTGRRIFVPLDRISPELIHATLATEDANFYSHPGVDPVALLRALYYAVQERDIVSGGSTITQQLVKMLLLSPERTVTRKIREAILSTEISRSYEKDDVLEIYLNELYYGNFSYGINAAAATYFNKSAEQLTLAEAALLAGLPQAPSFYDPYVNPERAKKRQGVVLGLMVEEGYITAEAATSAWLEPLIYTPFDFEVKWPHFIFYVRQQLEALYGSEAFSAGYDVTTSLDPDLQTRAQDIVRGNVQALSGNNVSNGALVALRPNTGEIIAFVGSADFDNVEIDGQVNMALAPRQPGSSIKPLVYLTAFTHPDKPVAERWTPGTLLADIEEEFPDGVNPPYVPTNYDLREHGMVTVRSALARSFNIPAVRAMQFVGIPTFLKTASDLGITTLTRPDYGLSLSLGAGEIPLLELTAAFSVLADHGRRMPPLAITKVADNRGRVLCDLATGTPCVPPGTLIKAQVVDPIDAFLITDILSDNDARAPVFGPNSVLQLDRPAAVKTGTTNDVRDNLTVGFTPQLVTGVWVGNSDNSPMQNVSGVSGAGPIWNQFMTFAHQAEPVVPFTPPPGVKQFEVCVDTGTLPSPACPERRMQWFAEARPPLPPEKDLYHLIRLDRTTGKLATEFTPSNAVEEKVFKVYPTAYRQWAEAHGLVQPPADESQVFNFQPELFIRQPVEGEQVSEIIQVVGSANAPAFSHYELQYGVSHNPGAFSPSVSGPHNVPMIDGPLGQWDVRGLQGGPHTLRLVVRDTFGTEYEASVRVFVTHPTPTPLPTPTWTPLPPPVEEPPATFTPEPVAPAAEKPTPAEEPTVAPLPTDTPLSPPVEEAPVEEAPVEETPGEGPPTIVPPAESGPTPTWTPAA